MKKQKEAKLIPATQKNAELQHLQKRIRVKILSYLAKCLCVRLGLYFYKNRVRHTYLSFNLNSFLADLRVQ